MGLLRGRASDDPTCRSSGMRRSARSAVKLEADRWRIRAAVAVPSLGVSHPRGSMELIAEPAQCGYGVATCAGAVRDR